jgi:hypothetical protein
MMPTTPPPHYDGVKVSASSGAVWVSGIDFYGDSNFVAKFDAFGKQLWTIYLSTFGMNGQMVDAAAEPDGLLLAGSQTGSFPGQQSFGEDDVLVLKLK